jgi:2-O-methyltransferase
LNPHEPPRPLRLADHAASLSRPSDAEIEFGRLFLHRPPQVVFDIGACEGEDSIRYARRFPSARVFAFEPLPANQALIRANFERFGARRAELIPVALADQAGEAEFHVSSGRPSRLYAGEDWNYGNKSSSLLPPASDGTMHGWVEFKETIKVRMETLDGFCAARSLERIDLIQMDVQGAEQRVLAGAGRMLPRTTAIWLEVSRRENYRGQALDHEIRRYLHAKGFRLCLQAYRGDQTGEGDHLYLNLRQARNWPYLATRPLRTFAGRIKRQLGG